MKNHITKGSVFYELFDKEEAEELERKAISRLGDPMPIYSWNRETDEVKEVVDEEAIQELRIGSQEDFEERRRLAQEKIGKFTVSTVFLATDHGWAFDQPILFETMVFSPIEDAHDFCRRYATPKAARKGHERIAGLIRFLSDAKLTDEEIDQRLRET